MSNLVEHAKRELRILGYTGEEPEDDPNRWMWDNTVELVERFSEQGHSGSSASYLVHVLGKILRWENVTPITDNPEDWIEVADDLWQCRRNPALFSNDGGKTYKDNNEAQPLHESEAHQA